MRIARLRLLLSSLLLISLGTRAQPMLREWTTYHDGNLNGYDVARDIQITDSQMVVVTGTSFHLFSGGNFTTLLLDELGNVRWKDHYYSAETGVLNGGQRIRTASGNVFYAVGTLAFRAGDISLMKYGPTGRRWTQNFTPSWFSDYLDEGIDLALDNDENLYAIGVATSTAGNLNDVYTIKCDSSGQVIWEEDYSGASGDDFPARILTGPSGGCHSLSGSFNFFGSGNYDFTLLEYNTTGTLVNTRYLDGPGNRSDHPRDSTSTVGGWYVCGTTATTSNNNDALIGLLNDNGTAGWRQTYAGTANQGDTAIQILETQTGDVVALLHSKELLNGSSRDAIVVRCYDAGGNLRWSWTTFGNDSLGALPAEMLLDATGTIMLCGSYTSSGQQSNGLLAAIDANGQELWMTGFDGGFNQHDGFTGIAIDTIGGIYVCGYSRNGIANSRYVIAKYSFNGTTGIPMSDAKRNIRVFPQPAAPGSIISLELGETLPPDVYSLLMTVEGKTVCVMEKFEVNDRVLRLQLPATIAAGSYLLVTSTAAQTFRQTILVQP